MSSNQSNTNIQSRGGDGSGPGDGGALQGDNLTQPVNGGGDDGGDENGGGPGPSGGGDDDRFFTPQFQITVANGSVTAISEVIGNHSFNLRIPSNATFTVGTGAITETLTGTHDTTAITFTTDPVNSALFDITNVTDTVANPTTTAANGDTTGFSFTITGGAVTAEQFSETHRGETHTRTITPPPDAVFTTGTGTVSETVASGNTVETINFVQPTGSTLFAVASTSTTFIPQGSATTALNVEPFERAMFTIDSSGAVTAVQSVSPNGTATSFTPDSHTTFTQLAPGFVEEVRTHGSHSSFEVFFAGSGSNGVYTAVAEGNGSTVDLVGLQAQIAALPAGVQAIL